MRPGWLRRTDFYHKHKYRIERLNDTVSFLSALLLILFLVGDQSHLAQKHQALNNDIRMMTITTGLHSGIFKIEDKVMRAMAQTPRHDFLGVDYRPYAYRNVALDKKQEDYKIPEPFISAVMIHLMEIEDGDTVLDIGYNSGYDSAVMSRLAREVYAINQESVLADEGDFPTAESQGYDNVVTRKGNGMAGWSEKGPYDAILVRQALEEPPQSLFRQLKPGGKLVIAIGPPNRTQRLMVYRKDGPDSYTERATLFLRLSPLLKGQKI